MIMKIYRILASMLVVLSMVSCFDDETTIGDLSTLSEITIEEGSILEVYNIQKNETLTISPVVSQSNKEKPLSYTWEIDLKEYSKEKNFEFYGDRLGSYNCRFIVENEDGKTFFPFKLYVNSPYEEGITILSSDPDGRPMLSFMQAPADPSEVGTFTTDELLTLNNEDVYFANNPTDILHSDATLFMVCQGGGASQDSPTMYYMNEKTFVVENMFSVPEYPEFKPTKILVPSNYGSYLLPLYVLSEDGKIYNFAISNAAVEPSPKLAYTYSQAVHMDDGGGYYAMVVWDKEAKALANVYNGGYGPYYLGPVRHMVRDAADFEENNYFSGKDFVTMVTVRSNSTQQRLDGYEVIVIATNGMMNYKVVLESSFWGSDDTGGYVVLDNGGFSMIGFGALPIDENTPSIASKTYQIMLFANGNKVRKWNYTTSQQLTAATTHLTVGSDNAVITGFEMSTDQKITYVSFYEPGEEGKNGSVWSFDTDSGEVLNKWENICYKPVKMIYKQK